MISWEEPFSHGFPILSYNLTVSNQSGHNIISEVLSGEMLAHNISTFTDGTSTSCDMLNFTLAASTSIGTSGEGHNTGGFPICKESVG